MALRDMFDGLLYRTRDTDPTPEHGTVHRSHPGLDVRWYWGGPDTPAPTSSLLNGWPDRPLTAALAVPVILRCVSGISTKVGKMRPLASVAGEPLATQPNHLTRPSVNESPGRFYTGTAADILTSRAFWRFVRGPGGELLDIERIRPADVSMSWADQRRTRRLYHVANLGTFPEGDVIHIPYLDVGGSLAGLSPLEAISGLVGAQLAADRLAASNFADGTYPSGVLKSETRLSREAARDLKEDWLNSQQGTREPAVLSGGVTFDPVQITAQHAQWIESRQWTAGDLARAFGYPAGALSLPQQGGTNLTYQNLREVRTDVLVEACDPVLCAIAHALDRWASPAGVDIDTWDTTSYLPAGDGLDERDMQGDPARDRPRPV